MRYRIKEIVLKDAPLSKNYKYWFIMKGLLLKIPDVGMIMLFPDSKNCFANTYNNSLVSTKN